MPAAAQYAARTVAPVAEDRSLFDDPIFGADDLHDDGYHQHEPEMAQDDLPPPAYRPRAPEPMAAAETFVAPRAAAAGTPTPEALARLRAAIDRREVAPRAPVADPRSAAPRAAEPAERPRFGLNSLINRMTGSLQDAPAPAARAQPPVSAPPARWQDEAQPAAPEVDRREIPAFLRRQAN